MSFCKSLMLAMIATLFLTYVFGVSLIEMLDVDVYVGNELIEPLKAISVSALVVVLLVVVALAIVLSVFGSIILVKDRYKNDENQNISTLMNFNFSDVL